MINIYTFNKVGDYMYNGKLNEYIERLPVKSIIVAKNLYDKFFYNLSEAAFIKNLERLVKKELLIVIGKGVYYKPQKSFMGMMGIADNELRNYFVDGNKSGLLMEIKAVLKEDMLYTININ